MNDFEGLLTTDYGFKPQGKSAPMAGSKPSSNNPTSSRVPNSFSGSYGVDPDSIFGAKRNQNSHAFDEFGDIFGDSSRKTGKSENRGGSDSTFKVDSGFNSSAGLPVYDKPVYDDENDIFDGVPGLKSSGSMKHEEMFASKKESESGRFDDLLAGLGKKESIPKSKGSTYTTDFDDLLPGFRGGSPPLRRPTAEADWSRRPSGSSKKMEGPSVGIGTASTRVASSSGLSSDPLDEINKLGNSRNTKSNGLSPSRGAVYDDLDPLGGFRKSVPPSFSSSERMSKGKDGSSVRTDHHFNESKGYSSKESAERFSARSPGAHSNGMTSKDNVRESQPTFDKPTVSNVSSSSPSYENGDSRGWSRENIESSDEVWLTVSEIPLFTQQTKAPPPSRPPPPRPARASKAGSSSFGSKIAPKVNEFSSRAARSGVATSVDELEDFVSGRSRSNNSSDDYANGIANEEVAMNSDAAASAAAMKEAMERAEAKFRHAKEVRERESTRTAARNKDEEKQERLERERLQREKAEEENEREQRRLERERARQAVERATREARERAAAEAWAKAEKAAVEKANTEARERAERAAVQRAQAEARERAAGEAKERAERAAAAAEARERPEKVAAAEAREKEARERAMEARMRAERAAVERVAAEARERAAAEARERAAREAREKVAAAAARTNQPKNDTDFDSFFNMGSQADNARFRTSAPEPTFNTQFQNRQGPGAAGKSSTTMQSNMKKAASATNIVDDLTSIFGGVASSGEFQEVEGESEDRRRARLERHQRTQERAAKALAEKNQRDLQSQREQEERHRISETLDIEIKRWAAGKEGNLRALLSTLQYVLWPECGWQPVSLTDLITGASVKKVYRKATLCIHPDKVQQKGANLQQKYIAEKVFDLLKEAWNKFNSEELF